jgi:hypothetical protein
MGLLILHNQVKSKKQKKNKPLGNVNCIKKNVINVLNELKKTFDHSIQI